MKTRYALIILLLLCSLVACKDKKPAPAPAPAPKPVVVPKDTVKRVVQEPKVIKQEKEQNFFIVAGCFEYKQNAERLVEKLKNEGYEYAGLVPYYENLYLVSYDGFPTKQEALSVLNEYHTEKGKKEAWLYSLK